MKVAAIARVVAGTAITITTTIIITEGTVIGAEAVGAGMATMGA
jgi:hypothetical protein